MKITKELEAKVVRLVREKYAQDLKDIQEKKNEVRVTNKDLVINHIVPLIESDSYLKRYFQQDKYGSETIGEFVARKYDKFIGLKEFDDLNLQQNAIDLKIKDEIETLLISISYEKSLDGIKQIFEDNGLTF